MVRIPTNTTVIPLRLDRGPGPAAAAQPHIRESRATLFLGRSIANVGNDVAALGFQLKERRDNEMRRASLLQAQTDISRTINTYLDEKLNNPDFTDPEDYYNEIPELVKPRLDQIDDSFVKAAAGEYVLAKLRQNSARAIGVAGENRRAVTLKSEDNQVLELGNEYAATIDNPAERFRIAGDVRAIYDDSTVRGNVAQRNTSANEIIGNMSLGLAAAMVVDAPQKLIDQIAEGGHFAGMTTRELIRFRNLAIESIEATGKEGEAKQQDIEVAMMKIMAKNAPEQLLQLMQQDAFQFATKTQQATALLAAQEEIESEGRDTEEALMIRMAREQPGLLIEAIDNGFFIDTDKKKQAEIRALAEDNIVAFRRDMSDGVAQQMIDENPAGFIALATTTQAFDDLSEKRLGQLLVEARKNIRASDRDQSLAIVEVLKENDPDALLDLLNQVPMPLHGLSKQEQAVAGNAAREAKRVEQADRSLADATVMAALAPGLMVEKRGFRNLRSMFPNLTDKQLADKMLEARKQLVKDGEKGKQRQAGEFKTRAEFAFENGLIETFDSIANEADELFEAGVLSEPEATAVKTRAIRELVGIRGTFASRQKWLDYLDGGPHPDPTDPDLRKSANQLYNEHMHDVLGGQDDPVAKKAEFVRLFGFTPDELQKEVKGGLVSPDAASAVRAAGLLETLLAQGPLVARDFTAEERSFALMLNKRTFQGESVQDAFVRTREAIFEADSAERSRRQQRWEDDGHDREDFARHPDVGVFFGPDFSDAANGEFNELVHREFLRTGDIDIARRSAQHSFESVWAVSEVGGRTRLQKFAPELTLPHNIPNPSDVHEEVLQLELEGLRLQGVDLPEGIFEDLPLPPETPGAPQPIERRIDMDKVRLETDPLTPRSAVPSFVVQVETDRGLDPVLAPDGQVLRWTPLPFLQTPEGQRQQAAFLKSDARKDKLERLIPDLQNLSSTDVRAQIELIQLKLFGGSLLESLEQSDAIGTLMQNLPNAVQQQLTPGQTITGQSTLTPGVVSP